MFIFQYRGSLASKPFLSILLVFPIYAFYIFFNEKCLSTTQLESTSTTVRLSISVLRFCIEYNIRTYVNSLLPPLLLFTIHPLRRLFLFTRLKHTTIWNQAENMYCVHISIYSLTNILIVFASSLRLLLEEFQSKRAESSRFIPLINIISTTCDEIILLISAWENYGLEFL